MRGFSMSIRVHGFIRIPAIALAALIATLPAIPVKPHEHVDADGSRVSWYPKECCHDGDCRPVASIKPAPNGLWMTTVDGHTIFVGPGDKRRPSRDMRWHICIGPDEMDDAGPRISACLSHAALGRPRRCRVDPSQDCDRSQRASARADCGMCAWPVGRLLTTQPMEFLSRAATKTGVQREPLSMA